ncbi:MAG: hypothetical protein NTX24_03545 [Candidatus Pacearchaeota archaeon]|nr:hypothetical protein [Candidatus Pacearchaeota archaeon]
MLPDLGMSIEGIAKIIAAEDMDYGEGRTEGGVTIYLPFRSQEYTDEYQVMMGLVHLVARYMQETRRQTWDYGERDAEKGIVCGESPTTGGLAIYDTSKGQMKEDGLHFFLNKTGGKRGVSIGWKGGMVLDDQLISLLSKELCDWLKQQLKKDS